jgi:hypothetical protein
MDGPGAPWRKLIRMKRQHTVWQIRLRVRGKEIVKEYTKEDDYRKWREAYLEQMQRKEVSGVEDIRTGIYYR